MNEKLKEFAARANFGNMENGEVLFDSRLQKFAELIIFRCTNIASHIQVFRPDDSIAGAIYEEFGIGIISEDDENE